MKVIRQFFFYYIWFIYLNFMIQFYKVCQPSQRFHFFCYGSLIKCRAGAPKLCPQCYVTFCLILIHLKLIPVFLLLLSLAILATYSLLLVFLFSKIYTVLLESLGASKCKVYYRYISLTKDSPVLIPDSFQKLLYNYYFSSQIFKF